MAAMTTVLTEFSDKEDSRTYTLSGHTAVRPNLVIQKRKVASGASGVASDTVSVIYGTVDEDGLPIASKVVFEVNVRRPVNIGSAETDITDALAVFRDIVAGDEFAATVSTQNYLS
jgi:hypothetical protein